MADLVAAYFFTHRASGEICGHPDSTEAGAIAICQAVEATTMDMSRVENAKNYGELTKTLNKTGCCVGRGL